MVPMRLDKFISNSSGLSRSQARMAIKKGLVKVSGVVIKNLAYHLPDEGPEVLLENQPLKLRGPVYIMLNKPLDTICSNVDEGLPSVLSLIDVLNARKLHIAGRLDSDTTGLVLVTDDGAWSHRVTSPRMECGKVYRVTLAESITDHAISSLSKGILLRGDGKACRPAEVRVLSEKLVLLEIFEGKYHQVKRMFAAVGNRVTALHREKIGDIALDPGLSAGEWRYLSDQEVRSRLISIETGSASKPSIP